MQDAVTGHQGAINERTAISDADIVAEVCADHEQVDIADPGLTRALQGAAMNRHMLAEDVLVSDP